MKTENSRKQKILQLSPQSSNQYLNKLYIQVKIFDARVTFLDGLRGGGERVSYNKGNFTNKLHYQNRRLNTLNELTDGYFPKKSLFHLFVFSYRKDFCSCFIIYQKLNSAIAATDF